jgi:hypothetical protein
VIIFLPHAWQNENSFLTGFPQYVQNLISPSGVVPVSVPAPPFVSSDD